MDYYALVPVKSLSVAKSRLDGHLSEDERTQLVTQMLEHVLMTLQSCKKITQIFVVTPDEQIKKFTSKYKATFLPEEQSGYNQSVTMAAKRIIQNNTTLLTIAADLPLLTIDDLQQMIQRTKNHAVVLAPAKDGGTNAIAMKSLQMLPYLFGKESFTKYQQEATKRKISVGVYQSETIAFDIDTIEDLKKLHSLLLPIPYKLSPIH